MKRGGGVHTVPSWLGGWCIKVDGEVVPVPLLKKDAVRYGLIDSVLQGPAPLRGKPKDSDAA